MTRQPGMSGASAVFTAFIVFTFYGLGAGYLESFVNYPLWRIVGETDRSIEYRRRWARASSSCWRSRAGALARGQRAAVLPQTGGCTAMDGNGGAHQLLIATGVDGGGSNPDPDPARCRLRAGGRRPVDHFSRGSRLIGGARAALVAYMLQRVVSAPGGACVAIAATR